MQARVVLAPAQPQAARRYPPCSARAASGAAWHRRMTFSSPPGPGPLLA